MAERSMAIPTPSRRRAQPCVKSSCSRLGGRLSSFRNHRWGTLRSRKREVTSSIT